MARTGDRREVFFLRGGRLPVESSTKFDWSLLKVKVSSDKHPYLACTSAEVGQALLLGRGIANECSLVAATDLDDRHYFDFGASPVLLFESKEQVSAYLNAPDSFPYAAHTFHFDLSTGEVKRAI